MRDGQDRPVDRSWEAIFRMYEIDQHDFEKAPFRVEARMIKRACQHFTETGEKEVRVLCKQDSRESRPRVFVERGLFLLPIKNGIYQIIKGEGYVNVPDIETPLIQYNSEFSFELETSTVGDSEMQHLDYAYALSLIRNFIGDDSLVLTIRGRKYTPPFSFRVGKFNIKVDGVQTEVDAGYEGRDRVVLVEAKNSQIRNTKNTIIRQLYYPYRKWQEHTRKKIIILFFERVVRPESDLEYHLWEFEFTDPENYNSIKLRKAGRYTIKR